MITRGSVLSRRMWSLKKAGQVAVWVLLAKAGGSSLAGSPMELLAKNVASWARDELDKQCPVCGSLPLFDEPHDTSRH